MRRTALVILLAAMPLVRRGVPSTYHSQEKGKLALSQGQDKSSRCKATFAVWDDEDTNNPRPGKLTDTQAAWVGGRMSRDYPGVCYVPTTTSIIPDVDYILSYGPTQRTLWGSMSLVAVQRMHPPPPASASFGTWVPVGLKSDSLLAALTAGVGYIYAMFACKATFNVVYLDSEGFRPGYLTGSQRDWLEKKEREKYPGVCLLYSSNPKLWDTPADYLVVYGDKAFIETGRSTSVYSSGDGATASAYSHPIGFDVSFVSVVDNTKEKELPVLYKGSGYARWRWQDASQKALEDAVRAICWKVSCKAK